MTDRNELTLEIANIDESDNVLLNKIRKSNPDLYNVIKQSHEESRGKYGLSAQFIATVVEAYYFTKILSRKSQIELSTDTEQALVHLSNKTIPLSIVSINGRFTIPLPINNTSSIHIDYMADCYNTVKEYIESQSLNVDVIISRFEQQDTVDNLNLLISLISSASLTKVVADKCSVEMTPIDLAIISKKIDDKNLFDLVKNVESLAKDTSKQVYQILARYNLINAPIPSHLRAFINGVPNAVAEQLIDRELVVQDLMIANQLDFSSENICIKTLLNELVMAHEREDIPFVFDRYTLIPRPTDAGNIIKSIITKYGV